MEAQLDLPKQQHHSTTSSSSCRRIKKKMKKNYEGFYLLSKLVDGGQEGETIMAHFNHILTGESVHPYSLRLTPVAEKKNLYDLDTKISNSISVRVQIVESSDDGKQEEEDDRNNNNNNNYENENEEDWMIPLRFSKTQIKPGHDWKIEEIVKKVLFFASSKRNKKDDYNKIGISLLEKNAVVDDDDGGDKKKKEEAGGHDAVALIIRNPNDGSAIHCIRYTT